MTKAACLPRQVNEIIELIMIEMDHQEYIDFYCNSDGLALLVFVALKRSCAISNSTVNSKF